jgi:hypothetical protein
LRARASVALNRSGHNAAAACREEWQHRVETKKKRAVRDDLSILTFQADKEDSPQESQVTPSKSRAHKSDDADVIVLIALCGRDLQKK